MDEVAVPLILHDTTAAVFHMSHQPHDRWHVFEGMCCFVKDRHDSIPTSIQFGEAAQSQFILVHIETLEASRTLQFGSEVVAFGVIDHTLFCVESQAVATLSGQHRRFKAKMKP